MDKLKQMISFTTTGGIMAQWLLRLTTPVTVRLLYLLAYV